MPIETEVKVPVSDLSPVEAKLRQLGAVPRGAFTQDDRFFDSAERALLEGDRGLRLRSIIRHDQPHASSPHLLTYKGPRQAGPVKQREEIELAVSDPDAMSDVLDRLGLRLVLHMQKRRRRYQLAECMVELDTLPMLGHFVEVEGPSAEAVTQAARQIGLDMTRSTTDSYVAMLMARAGRGPQAADPARFLLPDGE